jgi:hypothetical protein
MDIFGNTDPKLMPGHFFWSAIHLKYDSAIPADISKQNFSVCPRHWYIDADFQCATCQQEFTWTAGEQKAWFEEYHFWIDAFPVHCKKCRAATRHLQRLRKEYDSTVAAAKTGGRLDQKRRIVDILRELKISLGSLPKGMDETMELLERQIANRSERSAEGTSS